MPRPAAAAEVLPGRLVPGVARHLHATGSGPWTGAADEYLGPCLARHLAGMFGHAVVHVIDGTLH